MIKENKKESLKIIPLGGLGEIGRNMMLIEYNGRFLIIDMGLKFPEENMPGIDYVIPNASYLDDKKDKIDGIVITHGHYDHIGAIPYLLRKMNNPPFYASALTRGIILKRQEEFPDKKININLVKDKDVVNLGKFRVEFFRQNHNVPETLGVIVTTPVGNIVSTSDFKFDQDPINDLPTDFKKLKEIGNRGILLLMSDSTGAEEEGHSLSEKVIEKNLDEIFKKSKGRIIAATFSSLLNRIQQLISLSEKHNRKVYVEGFSMKNIVELARFLGYLKVKKDTLISGKDVERYQDSKITILCTGAQGEDRAALMKIVNKENRFVKIKKGDDIIFSSSVIPGNERTVQNIKDELYRQGAQVFHYKMMDIHAGGHAQQEELKEMIQMMNPKFFMPIHGQVSMLVSHGQLAEDVGIPKKNIIIAENGQMINISKNEFFVEKKTVPTNYIMVDGLGVGEVGEVVLRDRQMLAKDGMFVIVAVVDRQTGKVKGSPDIISRGFIYLRES
ncbi:MAG: ribonuclease J, partial [Candidatus Nealsonbacteria bacterium]|nr:ribonuclease J [Candidatus Nealsonbacteria bacterium]